MDQLAYMNTKMYENLTSGSGYNISSVMQCVHAYTHV